MGKLAHRPAAKLKPEAFFGQVNAFVGHFKTAKQKAIQKAKELEEEQKKANDKTLTSKQSDLAKKKAELEARKEALRRLDDHQNCTHSALGKRNRTRLQLRVY